MSRTRKTRSSVQISKNKFGTLSLRKRGKMKKCLYCGQELEDSSVIDFCQKCGVGVFGKKMFKAIVNNMTEAREKNNLYQSG